MGKKLEKNNEKNTKKQHKTMFFGELEWMRGRGVNAQYVVLCEGVDTIFGVCYNGYTYD